MTGVLLEKNDVGLQRYQLFRQRLHSLWISGRPPIVNLEVAAVHPSQSLELLGKSC